VRFDELRREFMSAAAALDVEEAERTLLRATLLVDERTLALEILAPILREVGSRWEAGTMKVCHEHAASSMIRNVIGGLLARRRQFNGQGRVTVLTATPSGELHELGAALMALLAAGRGFRVIFVGASVPVADLVLAAKSTGATIVGISVVNTPSREVRRELTRLAAELPPGVELVGGGPKAADSDPFARRARIFSRLEDFDAWLGERGAQHA
jgi:methanogenic corrinoid protein MtbC1